ncbi:variable surface lipoprotein [Metamycoplasma phocicerebrale]|uniref:Variable surface lipoprotein n=1 Tax=Metamycoplasma phocicerebrale TaxID=142649 RepID=A0A482KCW2_9BACT|nr:variable surface lipoprotein [Metamycoplasma phocicerebrale]QBQ01835.1 variable surface lipoprotein [Metamycoplasma phocicerebrale]
MKKSLKILLPLSGSLALATPLVAISCTNTEEKNC